MLLLLIVLPVCLHLLSTFGSFHLLPAQAPSHIRSPQLLKPGCTVLELELPCQISNDDQCNKDDRFREFMDLHFVLAPKFTTRRNSRSFCRPSDCQTERDYPCSACRFLISRLVEFRYVSRANRFDRPFNRDQGPSCARIRGCRGGLVGNHIPCLLVDFGRSGAIDQGVRPGDGWAYYPGFLARPSGNVSTIDFPSQASVYIKEMDLISLRRSEGAGPTKKNKSEEETVEAAPKRRPRFPKKPKQNETS